MTYSKPLKGGGSRLIDRGQQGRFQRATLEAQVCVECGAINTPKFVDDRETGGFVRKVAPTTCFRCGADLKTVSLKEISNA